MSSLIFIVGCFAVVLVCAAIAILSAGYAIDRATAMYDRWRWDQRRIAIQDIGHQIARDRYWMSEEKTVMEAFKVLGSSLQNYGQYEISNLRDAWRVEKSKLAKESK